MSTQTPKPTIISTDPGIDDAVAIAVALASDQLDIQLITPLAGNVDLENTTHNTLQLLTFLGKNVPVVPGSDRPLLRPTINASVIHGKSGMKGYPFPTPTVTADHTRSAVAAMHAVINHNTTKTTVIGIGPLTDIAILLHLYPADREKIAEIVLMGGALGRGNYGVLAEFNFVSDPEAAAMVFQSGVPIKVAPLEVGLQAEVMPATSEKIKHLGKVGDMFYGLFSHYRSGSFETGLRMYDALAIAMLVEPEMFTLVDTYIAIETQGALTAGASLIDLTGRLHHAPNATVATAVDPAQFEQWLVNAIAATNK
ncbi:nucleoside hydrolase [Schleiferilactobacillus perolens]|uniref:Inosine-uridine nucleoside N-ribohydrolase n=1 Tax=Schleiferilactobacillus perolens DSM 12744 TaxID=1423792 RepID=A0A0R1N338_9LACO|nr:nucleoside hydrolase [Schleiferilactobacillus perolens]KRL14710.1 inosine-uridine nucleoside N-ribohydrolase [Schleiferilactobacillus perolens DSM 12744]